MDAQLKALPILPVRARTVSGCVNSANLNISQHFTVHLFSPWIPSSARGKGGGPRRSNEPKDGCLPTSCVGPPRAELLRPFQVLSRSRGTRLRSGLRTRPEGAGQVSTGGGAPHPPGVGPACGVGPVRLFFAACQCGTSCPPLKRMSGIGHDIAVVSRLVAYHTGLVASGCRDREPAPT